MRAGPLPLLFALTLPAFAQDGAAPGLDLVRARLRGSPEAVRALLGEQRLRDPRGDEVRVEVGVDDPDAPRTLRWAVRFQTEGGMREESLRLEGALDLESGALELGYQLVRGRQRVAAGGRAEAGRLRWEVRAAREDGSEDVTRTELDWPEQALPFSLALFVLPRLLGPGEGACPVRVFHPVTAQLDAVATLRWRPASEVLEVELDPFLPGQVARVQVGRDGGLLEVDLGGGERLVAPR